MVSSSLCLTDFWTEISQNWQMFLWDQGCVLIILKLTCMLGVDIWQTAGTDTKPRCHQTVVNGFCGGLLLATSRTPFKYMWKCAPIFHWRRRRGLLHIAPSDSCHTTMTLLMLMLLMDTKFIVKLNIFKWCASGGDTTDRGSYLGRGETLRVFAESLCCWRTMCCLSHTFHISTLTLL